MTPNACRTLCNRLRCVGVGLFLVGAMAGCALGDRPELVDPPPGGEAGTSTGDAAADAVVSLFERDDPEAFTISYELTRRLGDVSTTATVTQDGGERRSVTIGQVRYVTGQFDKTCRLDTPVCEDGLIAARTSDTGFAADFDANAPARRLRIAVARAAGPTTAASETIAGQNAQCVSVPVGTGTETFCAFENGRLARWDTADLAAVATSFQPIGDESLLSAP